MSDDLKNVFTALNKIAEVASEAANELQGYCPDDSPTKGVPLKKPTTKRSRNDADRINPFQLRSEDGAQGQVKSQKHVYGRGVVCDTEKRGYATPDNLSPSKIRVDATEGFIPLWAKGMTLRWRFRESSMLVFDDPEAAKAAIEGLFGEALSAWGDSAPVRFKKQSDAWDFEFVMRGTNDCDDSGCVLAAAFFPDGGQHKVELYPRLFEQSRQELVETLMHEVGHVFGLRHFFANVSETAWPSELFGTDEPFSIMNYGSRSVLTDVDKADLKRLYEAAWSGELTNINGTPIRFVKPFHTVGDPPDNLVAVLRGQSY